MTEAQRRIGTAYCLGLRDSATMGWIDQIHNGLKINGGTHLSASMGGVATKAQARCVVRRTCPRQWDGVTNGLSFLVRAVVDIIATYKIRY
jgi:hypothetical protein